MTSKELLQSPFISGDEKIAFIKTAVKNQTTSLKEKIVADLKAYLSIDEVFNNELIFLLINYYMKLILFHIIQGEQERNTSFFSRRFPIENQVIKNVF